MVLDLKKLRAIAEVLFYQSNARGALNPSTYIQVRTFYEALCILSNISNIASDVKGSDWEHHAKSQRGWQVSRHKFEHETFRWKVHTNHWTVILYI